MLFSALMCNRSQQQTIMDLESQLKIADNRSAVFESKVNELGQHIATQNQTLVTERAAIEQLKKENQYMKLLASNVKVAVQTKFPEIKIPYDAEPEIVQIDTNEYLKIPATFTDTTNKWYKLIASIDTTGLHIKNLTVNNELSITIGTEKQGFFKKDKPVVIVKNNNPYTQTVSMNNMIVLPQKKWHERRGLWYGLGALTGFLIFSQ